MTNRNAIDKISAVAVININGEEGAGLVMLALVYDEQAEKDASNSWRWYGLGDVDGEWYDTETSAGSRDEAIEAAATAWQGEDWDLRWPGDTEWAQGGRA